MRGAVSRGENDNSGRRKTEKNAEKRETSAGENADGVSVSLLLRLLLLLLLLLDVVFNVVCARGGRHVFSRRVSLARATWYTRWRTRNCCAHRGDRIPPDRRPGSVLLLRCFLLLPSDGPCRRRASRGIEHVHVVVASNGNSCNRCGTSSSSVTRGKY